MPLNVLRNIDIHDLDEEKLLQEIINSKLQVSPVQTVINNPFDKTDFKNREEEVEFQKTIDARLERARPTVGLVTVDPIEAKIETNEVEQTLTKKIAAIKKAKRKLE